MDCELCAKQNLLSFKYIWNNRLVKVCQECKENDLKKLKKYLATKPKSYKIIDYCPVSKQFLLLEGMK